MSSSPVGVAAAMSRRSRWLCRTAPVQLDRVPPREQPEEIAAICVLDNVFAYICWHDLRFESFVRRSLPDDARFWTPTAACSYPAR